MVKMVTATTIEYFLEILSATHLKTAESAYSPTIRFETQHLIGYILAPVYGTLLRLGYGAGKEHY